MNMAYGATNEIIELIRELRNKALKRVNEELIRLYWNVGEFLSKESKKAVFGDAYIDTVVSDISVMMLWEDKHAGDGKDLCSIFCKPCVW